MRGSSWIAATRIAPEFIFDGYARSVPRRLSLALAATVVAVGVLAFLLLRDGKDTVPLSTVANAAEATNDAGGFKMSIDGSFEVPGVRKLPLKGTGELDPKARRGHLLFTEAGPLALGGGQGGIEQIFEGDVIYMKMPQVAQQLGGKKQWIKVDIKEAGRALGVDPAQFGQLGGNDPRKVLDQVRAVSGEVEEVGSEKVRGADTTHYRAEVDLRKYPDRLPEKDREQARVAVEKLIDQTGSSTYPMDLWIDGEDLLRRVRISYDFQVPGVDKNAEFAMTMEFFDFGTPIQIKPPPEKDVADLAELARSLPQGQTQ
jgi:hypothetical protein